MFILLRRIERWLHQHVFKVGWLTTQNYQTTTILYYTVFLPGVVLHEVVYYLAAGLLNVRAERDIKWPDEQEVGELNLNFVKLAPRTSAFRKAWITSAPLFVGLIIIWLIASNVFDITAVTARMSSGELRDVGAAINLLLSAPLFWFWVYIVFTIANTMFPTVPKDLKGWRSILIGLAVVGTVLVAIGIGGSIFEALQAPISNIISVLQATFILIMGIDVVMVLILGLIEYTIERVTGNSATFKGNRMYTMTREEAIAERERQREAARRKAEREKKKRAAQTAGPQTIYALSFSVPGAPKVEGITPLFPEEPEAEETEDVEEDVVEKPKPMPSFGGLAEDGNEKKPELNEEEKRQRQAIAERVNLFGSEDENERDTVDEQDKGIEEAVQSVTDTASTPPSRFGQSLSKPVKDPAEEDAIARAAQRSEMPQTEASNDENVQPAATTSSRFDRSGRGLRQTPSKDDIEPDTEKSTVRRFGQSTADSARDDDKPASDDLEKETSPPASRFGPPARFGQSTPADDDTSPDGSPDTDDSTNKTTSSRFGSAIRGFGGTKSAEEDSEQPDASTSQFSRSARRFGDGEETPRSSSITSSEIEREDIRVVGRPVTPSKVENDLDDFEPDEDVLKRRGRGDADAVASLFGPFDDDATDDDDESVGQSRFGSASFLGQTSSDDNDSDEPDTAGSSLSRYRRSTPLSTRFGSSRPAPKPSDKAKYGENDGDEDVTLDDDAIVYEDVEDYYDPDDHYYYPDED